MLKNSAPRTKQALQDRAREMTGLSIGELAKRQKIQLPQNLKYDKGLIGQLLEAHLGATAGCLPVPDFVHLNIELKTIPINRQGKPLESTYVCKASLRPTAENQSWETSWVKQKLNFVLFVPILSEPELNVEQRIIASPIFWQPCETIALTLKQDWEELTEMLLLGQFETLTAKRGNYLQIRPKAANTRVLEQVINHEGAIVQTVPKGFYLRSKLTEKIIEYSVI